MRKPALLFLVFCSLAGIGFFGAKMQHRWSQATVTPSASATPPPIPTASQQSALRPIHGLIRVNDPSLVVDLRYAGTHNFTGQRIYQQACLVLNEHTARKVLAANAEFQTLGYRLKIWDAYRPLSAQRVLWRKFPHGGFVADPSTGSMHNRGAAVDVTLVNAQGQELLMPSAFDEFTPRARIDYQQAPTEAMRNRELLARVMLKHGFQRIKHEWWHFQDTQGKKYPLQDIPFTKFKS